jgi:hypothetical protein
MFFFSAFFKWNIYSQLIVAYGFPVAFIEYVQLDNMAEWGLVSEKSMRRTVKIAFVKTKMN